MEVISAEALFRAVSSLWLSRAVSFIMNERAADVKHFPELCERSELIAKAYEGAGGAPSLEPVGQESGLLGSGLVSEVRAILRD